MSETSDITSRSKAELDETIEEHGLQGKSDTTRKLVGDAANEIKERLDETAGRRGT